MGTTNHQHKPDSGESTNRVSVLQESLRRIESAYRVELNDRERRVYSQELADVPADLMIPATGDCIREWKPQFGVSFPPVSTILEFVQRLRGAQKLHEDSKPILQREEKPVDWVAIGRKSGVTAEQIAEWLEGGRREQREHIARLETDPQWREMATRLGAMPGLRAQLPDSEVPADPEERRSWARKKATDAGWVS